MSLFKSRSCAFLIVAALFSIVCYQVQAAQTAETGAIAGKLSDVNGTAIAAATVTSVHDSTGQLRSATTDKNGAYEFTLLPPGTYTVRFAASGHTTIEVRVVTVNAGDAVTISQTLNPGSNSEVSVIQWVAPEVPGTATGADTQEIAVKSIPLASRNYTQAAGMSAGVSSQVSNATAIGINTQGVQVGSGNTNNYVMDGAPVASNTQGPVSPGIPNPDAIQDNNVQSWTYDAGTGRYAGANISVVTKSGTNTFHGTLFEFVRNDIFNSNDYFLKQEGVSEPVLKQNQFGFTFGGPIRKDKVFIFGSYQGTRQRNGFSPSGFAQGVILPPLPTTRTAESVGAANCPASHPGDTRYQTVQGGVQVACDGSNINPVALNILNLKLSNGAYYLPGSSTEDFQSTPYSIPAKFQEDQFLVNTDYVVTSKHTISERFFYSHDPQFSNFTGSPSSLPGAPSNIVTGNISAVVKLVSTLTPNLSNELRISGQHYLLTDTPLVPFTNGDVGISSVVPQFNTLDIVNIAGLINLGGNGTWDHNSVNQYQAADQVSWVHGRQTFRLGFDADRRQWNITVLGDSIGELNIGSFADFLLGLPGCPPGSAGCSIANPAVLENGVEVTTNGSAFSNINVSTGPSGYAAIVTGPDGINHAYRFSDYAGYLQDDFKAASRLTLNLGLRWDYFSLPSDDTGNITTFWTSLVAAGSAVPATASYPGYVVPSNFKGELAPGVTRNTRRTPIPIGAPVTDFAPRVGFAWQPLSTSSLAIRGGYGLYFDRPDSGMLSGFANAAVPYATPVGGAGAANYQASLAQPYLPTALGWGPTRTVDFADQSSSNLTLRMLDENFSALLTQKWNLEIQQQLPANLILALGYAGAHSVHMQNSDREINGALLASPSNPVNGITTNTVANAALRVPYLGIAANGLDDQQTQASAKYNSLQATLRKQISHGVQVQAAYTFSKTLATTAMGPSMDSNDPLNARQQYGPSGGAAPQRLAVNYSWDLPYKGAGTRGKLLGDWSLSGMTIIQSGTPLTIGDPRGGSIYGNAGMSRAQFCPGTGPADAATKGGVKDRLNAYFNAAAFNSSCLPPIIGDGYGYGNSSVGFILGPGQDNTDLSVHKSIAIKESKMELRVELFNAFNHPQFMGPDPNVPDPGFGRIISTSVNPRLIQFALKYSF